MACPYLKEVVMLFCDAYCVKKMLPLDRIATANPCLGEFNSCPLFQELMARLTANAAAGTGAGIPACAGLRDGPKGRLPMILALPFSFVALAAVAVSLILSRCRAAAR